MFNSSNFFAAVKLADERKGLRTGMRPAWEPPQGARPEPLPAPEAPLRASAKARRPVRPWDREQSIRRRRRLVSSGPLPGWLAARFTWGEVAVMRIVGDECRARGFCDLHIDAIAARAGVHRTTVQNALREAQGKGEQFNIPIIHVQERRRKGQRSLTNIIRIVLPAWSDWLRKGPRRAAEGVGSNRTQSKKMSTTDTRFKKEKRLGEVERRYASGVAQAPKVPDRGDDPDNARGRD